MNHTEFCLLLDLNCDEWHDEMNFYATIYGNVGITIKISIGGNLN